VEICELLALDSTLVFLYDAKALKRNLQIRTFSSPKWDTRKRATQPQEEYRCVFPAIRFLFFSLTECEGTRSLQFNQQLNSKVHTIPSSVLCETNMYTVLADRCTCIHIKDVTRTVEPIQNTQTLILHFSSEKINLSLRV